MSNNYNDIQLARDTDAKLTAGAQVDGMAGDMLTDGWHAYRLGSVVVVSDHDGGLGAKRFDSEKAAQAALDKLTKRPV